MPLGMPGALAAVIAGTGVHWLRAWATGSSHGLATVGRPALAIPWPTLAWIDALPVAVPYFSIALPFALVTTVGGIDNTESAAAAGDQYRTRDVLLTEALATCLAAFAGGVVQNTPYIGHPAYKAMGARAGYTLATGIVIGGGAAVGALSVLVGILPEAAVAPILIFIGLEIAAQAFLASPREHGPAVALTFVPVAAAVVSLESGTFLGAVGRSAADLSGDAALAFAALTMLANGFILSAVLWGSGLTAIIDRRFAAAAAVLAIASAASLSGLVHSPLPGGALFWPWNLPSAAPAHVAGAYGVAAVLCWLLGFPRR